MTFGDECLNWLNDRIHKARKMREALPQTEGQTMATNADAVRAEILKNPVKRLNMFAFIPVIDPAELTAISPELEKESVEAYRKAADAMRGKIIIGLGLPPTVLNDQHEDFPIR